MNTTGAQELTAKEYGWLLAHASRHPDFVHLGGASTAAATGDLVGFACLAETEYKQKIKTYGSVVGMQHSASLFEQAISQYQVAYKQTKEYLTGGWVGSLAFELGYMQEERLSGLKHTLRLPVLFAEFYLWIASYNKNTGKHYLWTHPACPSYKIAKINAWRRTPAAKVGSDWQITTPFSPTQTAATYLESIGTIKRYIRDGDCYQVNLSQEFKGRYRGDAWDAYVALTKANPTPFSAFLRQDGCDVLSVSPERFLGFDRDIVKTSPIKGTRARGATPAEDLSLAQELLSSEKDRAENLMIVDLLRNDLSVNALPGSVSVDKLFALETYENVHHLVSHIRAKLKPQVSPMQALFDAFPGGSITGAPKIRAMEIIRELEPHWRGPYCGSIFYYGLDGTLDSNIAIRTMLCENEQTDAAGEEHGTIRCWGGGGIVADSDPESEYQETLTKVKPLMDFLEKLNQGEC